MRVRESGAHVPALDSLPDLNPDELEIIRDFRSLQTSFPLPFPPSEVAAFLYLKGIVGQEEREERFRYFGSLTAAIISHRAEPDKGPEGAVT